MLNDILNKNLTNDTLVLEAGFSTEQQELLERRDIHYLDFMRDEIVTEENAVATAEGVIAELVNHSPYNIEGGKIIVTGYGCCGRAGGCVAESARRARDSPGKKKGSAQTCQEGWILCRGFCVWTGGSDGGGNAGQHGSGTCGYRCDHPRTAADAYILDIASKTGRYGFCLRQRVRHPCGSGT